MTEQELRELFHYKDSALFGPVEKMVLDLVVAMTHTPARVSDELFAELQKHL